MKSIFEWYTLLPANQWDYYYSINHEHNGISNPFINDAGYDVFIKNYFMRGGKIDIFEYSQIKIESLRLPNHISSVFFLGSCLYFYTSMHKKYSIKDNEPGYHAFPFIWFLIALFHDNAYQMEDENAFKHISTLEDLYKEFEIEHFILDTPCSKCKPLGNARKRYFEYRREEYGIIDHGLLGGILLYDRLVKIRKAKRAANENTLFWGIKLVNQYKLAANAITLHNIWLPSPDRLERYKKHQIDYLAKERPVKCRDFPLFYLLGIVDTIEPLKTYRTEIDRGTFTNEEVLRSINMAFEQNSVKVSLADQATIDFKKMLEKAKGLRPWLDVDINTSESSFELTFN